ncbi:hypothetical protein YC2023_031089 [Brassica napus]
MESRLKLVLTRYDFVAYDSDCESLPYCLSTTIQIRSGDGVNQSTFQSDIDTAEDDVDAANDDYRFISGHYSGRSFR